MPIINWGAYNAEVELLERDLQNGEIDVEEYNKRLKEIEDEVND